MSARAVAVGLVAGVGCANASTSARPPVAAAVVSNAPNAMDLQVWGGNEHDADVALLHYLPRPGGAFALFSKGRGAVADLDLPEAAGMYLVRQDPTGHSAATLPLGDGYGPPHLIPRTAGGVWLAYEPWTPQRTMLPLTVLAIDDDCTVSARRAIDGATMVAGLAETDDGGVILRVYGTPFPGRLLRLDQALLVTRELPVPVDEYWNDVAVSPSGDIAVVGGRREGSVGFVDVRAPDLSLVQRVDTPGLGFNASAWVGDVLLASGGGPCEAGEQDTHCAAVVRIIDGAVAWTALGPRGSVGENALATDGQAVAVIETQFGGPDVFGDDPPGPATAGRLRVMLFDAATGAALRWTTISPTAGAYSRGASFDAAGQLFVSGSMSGEFEYKGRTWATFWRELAARPTGQWTSSLLGMQPPERERRYEFRSAAFLLRVPPP